METVLILKFPSLKVLSDRTVRSTLKLISKIVHKITIEEIKFFIDRSELNSSQRQSILDRLIPEIEGENNYYIEVLKKGSLELEVIVGAIPFFYLAKITLGKSLGEAYENSDLNRWLVNFLNNTILRNSKSAKNEKKLPAKSKAIHGTRWKFLQSQYELHLAEGGKFERFEV